MKKLLTLFFISMFLVSCKKDKKNIDLSADLINTNNLIKEVINEIQNSYVDDISKEKLEIGAITGMLNTLDEHSVYISKDEFGIYNDSARGAFLGIGIEIKQIRDGIEIQSVIDNSPAANSGIKPLDIITHINGENVCNIRMKDIIKKLGNDSITKIKISILRNKTEKLELTVKKSVIQLQSVKLDFIGDVGLIKISYFNERTLFCVTQAIKKINKKSASGVIIDLRNNPGGILEQAIGISDLFLSNKKIIELKSRNIEENQTFFSDDIDLLNGIPIVVLINNGTASGAELMASALGENKRAVLIGERTYGKGSLQTIIPIPGRGAIKLTTAYFISPNGNIINQNGVTPDIEIKQNDIKKQNENIDPIIQRALDLIHGLLVLNETEK